MLRKYIQKDFDRYPFSILNKCQKLELIKQLIFAYGFQAVVVYRLGQWIIGREKSDRLYFLKFLFFPFYYVLNNMMKYMYGISLSRQATIGPGLFIGHFGNIKIGKCVLGENCSIQQSVHITPDEWKDARPPHIGSRVWIGGHAVIHGEIKINDNATIAAGANVTHDVPAGCLVAGNPARIVNRNYDNATILGLNRR